MAEITDDLEQREEKLKAELKKIQAEKKERDDQIARVIGQAVLKKMRGDSAFNAEMKSLLSPLIKGKRDRKLIGLNDNQTLSSPATEPVNTAAVSR